MRLDATDLRYVSQDEFRVLTAVEIGSKNHEVVPTPLIAELSTIRSGVVSKCLSSLAKRGLVARVQGAKYEGFRLTYGGLDYLSLRTFSRRKPASVAAVGKKIGVGKESDIYIVKDESGLERVLKLHRLGRISFRAIKEKRDYLGKRKSASWMYMSRLAAEKEFTFMKVLYEHGFPVPVPVDQARHCIVMSLIDSYPLRQVSEVESPSELYATLMDLLLRLAHCGLIHCDYNEFNLLIGRKHGEVTLIDFPQMVSVRHVNAEYFFNRDVECIKRFFRRRFRYEAATWPRWKDVLEGLVAAADAEKTQETSEGGQTEAPPTSDATEGKGDAKAKSKEASKDADPTVEGEDVLVRLDEIVEASGWKGDMQQQLEQYMIDVGDMPGEGSGDDYSTDEDTESEDEEEDTSPQSPLHTRQSPPAETLDEEAFQAKMAARMESLRLNRALGNDDPDEVDLDHGAGSEEENTEDDYSDESDSDSEAGSVGPAPTDYTSYVRPPKAPKERMSVKKMGKKDVVKDKVEQEISSKSARGGKKGGGVGKGKGHKWKSSARNVVGDVNGISGW